MIVSGKINSLLLQGGIFFDNDRTQLMTLHFMFEVDEATRDHQSAEGHEGNHMRLLFLCILDRIADSFELVQPMHIMYSAERCLR